MNPIQAARAAGQQIWLDNLSRALISSGELARFIEMGVAGVTTNPAIFHKAIAEGQDYRPALAAMDASLGAEARYEGLVIEDVQRACDVIRPVFEASQGDAGYVSLEVSPALADDEAGTVAAARRLRAAVARDNLLVKIPATAAGVGAIETLTGEGVSINVTLMFSLAHVEAVAGAYQRGLEKLAAAGGDIARVRSVASVFLSRWDSLIDKQLDEIGTPEALALRGKAGVALARQAYQRLLASRQELRAATLGLARIDIRQRKPESAIVHYEALLAKEPGDTLAMAGLGVAYDLLGQHARAQAVYRKGLEMHPADLGLRNNLGLSLVLSNQPRAGANVLLDLADVPSAPPQSRQNLALAYGLLGNDDAAERVLTADLPDSQVQDNLRFYRAMRQQLPSAVR